MLGIGEENVENSCGLYFILLRLKRIEKIVMMGLIPSILESVAVISLVGVDVPTAFFGFSFFFLPFLFGLLFGVLSFLVLLHLAPHFDTVLSTRVGITQNLLASIYLGCFDS